MVVYSAESRVESRVLSLPSIVHPGKRKILCTIRTTGSTNGTKRTNHPKLGQSNHTNQPGSSPSTPILITGHDRLTHILFFLFSSWLRFSRLFLLYTSRGYSRIILSHTHTHTLYRVHTHTLSVPRAQLPLSVRFSSGVRTTWKTFFSGHHSRSPPIAYPESPHRPVLPSLTLLHFGSFLLSRFLR